jgi:hypothetical protein
LGHCSVFPNDGAAGSRRKLQSGSNGYGGDETNIKLDNAQRLKGLYDETLHERQEQGAMNDTRLTIGVTMKRIVIARCRRIGCDPLAGQGANSPRRHPRFSG